MNKIRQLTGEKTTLLYVIHAFVNNIRSSANYRDLLVAGRSTICDK